MYVAPFKEMEAVEKLTGLKYDEMYNQYTYRDEYVSKYLYISREIIKYKEITKKGDIYYDIPTKWLRPLADILEVK